MMSPLTPTGGYVNRIAAPKIRSRILGSISHSSPEAKFSSRWPSPRKGRWCAAPCPRPATREPEGFTAESGKGNVRTLAPGARAAFSVRAGYVDRRAASALAGTIAAMTA